MKDKKIKAGGENVVTVVVKTAHAQCCATARAEQSLTLEKPLQRLH